MDNWIRRCAVVAIIAICAILNAPRATQAQVLGPVRAARIPDFESIAAGQQCPSWCWAASVQMVARSQGVDLPHEVVVRKIYGPTIPCLPSGNIQNILAGIQGVYRRSDGSMVAIQARALVGNQGYAMPLIQSIQSGRPFIFLTRTHAMVAVGVHWADVFTPWGQPTGLVQILDIELIDPFFTFGATEFNTFPIRPDTVNQISGAIEIQSIRLTNPSGGATDESADEPRGRERNTDDSDREQAIQECMEDRPEACVESWDERRGRGEAFCRGVACRPDDPGNIRAWRRLCERRVDRERRP